MNAQLLGSLQYQAPGGGQAVLPLSAQATYTAQALGTVDIPSGTAANTAIQIPLGAVATGLGYYVKTNHAIRLAVNGATGTSAMQGIATGGVAASLSPRTAPSQGITSMFVVTVETARGDGAVDYAIFGD